MTTDFKDKDAHESLTLVETLIRQGEINIINPGFGEKSHELSIPIATSYVRVGEQIGILVSNSFYDKPLQIFGKNGKVLGFLNDSRFRRASAMTSDFEGVYITDDATGLTAKFSPDLQKIDWTFNPDDGKVLSGRFGSLTVNENYLLAFDTALSRIHRFDKFTGEWIGSIGEHQPISIADAKKENLIPVDKVAFNGHFDIAFYRGNIVAAQGGIDWEGLCVSPNIVMIISLDGKLISGVKLSSKVSEISGVTTDIKNGVFFLGNKDNLYVFDEKGLVGLIPVPNFQNGDIFNLHYDQESGDLVVCHGTSGRKSTPGYSQIAILPEKARKLLLRKTIGPQEVKFLGPLPENS